MATDARLKANAKYHAKFEVVRFRVHLGELDKIKAYAESQGKSLNAYINDLIKADMSKGSTDVEKGL